MSRLAAALACLSLILIAAPRAGAREDKKPEAPAGFATPEKAFEAYLAALKKSDWEAVYATLTPDSAERQLGRVVVRIGAAMALAKLDNTGKIKEKLKPAVEQLEKAGLSEDAVAQAVKQTAEAKNDTQARTDIARKLVAGVKNKAVLFGGLMQQMDKINPNKPPDASGAKMKDVKIDGDKASITLVSKKGDAEEEQKLSFEKVKGGWLFELPEGGLGAAKGK